MRFKREFSEEIPVQKNTQYHNLKQKLEEHGSIRSEYFEESREYEAVAFSFRGKHFKFRCGKKTPKKEGFFVAVWKRVQGKTLPHDMSDKVDCFMIGVEDEKGAGCFAFPRSLLAEKGIKRNIVHRRRRRKKRISHLSSLGCGVFSSGNQV